MAICDLDVAPAFERSKHHEEIGGAIALVLVIETGRASRFHRDRHARFGNELLWRLVEANQRTIAVAWPRADGQHVFHSGYERAVGLRPGDPVLAAVGAKSIFCSPRPPLLLTPPSPPSRHAGGAPCRADSGLQAVRVPHRSAA